jgi:hypothetical protein
MRLLMVPSSPISMVVAPVMSVCVSACVFVCVRACACLYPALGRKM